MSVNIFNGLVELLFIYKFELYLLIFSILFYPMMIKAITSSIEDDIQIFIINKHPNESIQEATNKLKTSVYNLITNATLFIVLGSWVAYWYPKLIIQSAILFVGFTI
jgi:hypothetical protein